MNHAEYPLVRYASNGEFQFFVFFFMRRFFLPSKMACLFLSLQNSCWLPAGNRW